MVIGVGDPDRGDWQRWSVFFNAHDLIPRVGDVIMCLQGPSIEPSWHDLCLYRCTIGSRQAAKKL